MPFNDIYKGKNVLVTGHTGFKGSWLSTWLSILGARVSGLALKPKTVRDNFVVSGLEGKIGHYICDVRDKVRLLSVFEKVKPDIVFHLAAQPIVKLSYDDPIETYETNFLGTLNILETIRRTESVKASVMITSDKCYKNDERSIGYKETDTLGGVDPYSASKACTEILISSHQDSYFEEKGSANIASVRAGNVIGGGDWSEGRIIPDIIKALSSDTPVVELRNPNSVRPWQFVLEPLSGYLSLGEKLLSENGSPFSSSWNFGPDMHNVYSTRQLTERIIDIWGKGEIRDISSKTGFHEAGLLILDCSKSREKLKWTHTLSFNESANFTVNWFREFFKFSKMYDFNVGQIKEYSEKSADRDAEWVK